MLKMSGPTASLKKSKKSPLTSGSFASNGKKNVPFRSPGYTADESLLLDQITGNMAASRLSNVRSSMGTDPITGGVPATRQSHEINHKPSKSIKPKQSKGGPSDNELMALMMSRLAGLEGRLQFQAKEIQEKDKKIKILEEKLHIVGKAKEHNVAGGGSSKELEKRCLILQEQIHEMEDFLADYGMVWVGETSNPDSDVYYEDPIEQPASQEMWKPSESRAGDSDFALDYDRVLENIEELNALAGEGVGTVQHNSDGARIKMPETIPLTLYSNGMVMFSGPFRPFEDAETQLCMQDIMDGYFPSELQGRYPEGVPFFVKDKRTVYFKDKTSQIFKGHGQTLGGETKPSRLVPSRLQGKDHASQTVGDEEEEEGDVETELPGRKLSMDQFLNRLPQNVIKHGKVIDIRSSVGHAIQGSEGPNKVTVVDTEAVQQMKERLGLAEKDRPPSGNFTTLRIKDEKGENTYILKMRFNDTVGNIRQHLTKHRPKNAPPYAIVSSFPTKSYDDFYATLEDCGLVPNATLYLKPTRRT